METPEIDNPGSSKPKPNSKKIMIATLVTGGVLIIFASFAAGVRVGLRKARFSYRFGENYERNFMSSRFDDGRGMMGRPGLIGGMMRDFSGRDFRNAHGLAGTIISITNNSLIIKDRDNKENTVAVTDKTVIRQGRDNLNINDLKANDQIVVIGNPGENGVINADLIRIFPVNNNPVNSNLNNNKQNN